ncbi:MAG TPA: MFS transporter [Oligoflexus sp.]|uniref:MFS transporter n=1 Tax=Oligoflexus sp. TaxID=1971216 RepID=UPI002D51A99E|nr:MFS transporter [Oligoflexus sp.]HYX38391.1 MFS transporter [Oligoflexus sp.]
MSHAHRKMIWSLGIAQCLSWGILFYAFSVLLPPMTESLPISHSSISFMATLSALIAAAVSVPIGRRLDLGGHLRIMMGGSLLGVIGCGIWSWSTSALGLYTAAVFIGMAQAASLYEPVFAFLLHAFPEEKERSSAMMQVTLIGGLASTIFLPLTTYLTEILGWQGAIRILALLLLIPVAIYKFWVKTPGTAETHSVVPTPHRQISLNLAFLSGTTRKIFLMMVLVFLINGIVHTTMTTHLPSALQSWGFGALEASWAVGIMGASQLLGRLGLGSYLRLLKNGSLLIAPLIIISLGLGLLPYCQHDALRWLLLVIIGSSSGLLTLLRPTVVSRLFDRQIFGRINGVLALSYQLARAGGPVGGSWVYEASRGYDAVFLVLAIMLFIAAFVSSYLGKSQ